MLEMEPKETIMDDTGQFSGDIAKKIKKSSSDFLIKSEKIKTTRNRIAFFFLGLCALSIQSFMNVIANTALGAGKHTAVIMLALYLPQVLLRIFTEYWTKWISYHGRLMLTAALSVTALILLYSFMDKSSNIPDKSLWHLSRICVLLSTSLTGISTTIGSVTGFGYCTYFDRHCTNCMSAGEGFGALLGASISLIQNELHFSNKSIIIGCFLFPIGLTFSYAVGLDHASKGIDADLNEERPTKNEVPSASVSEMTITVNGGEQKTTPKPSAMDLHDLPAALADVCASEQISARMTIKLLVVDLCKYTLPLFCVYFLYNIIIAGFIAPSFDVEDRLIGQPIKSYKKVYQYFIFSLRIGVFLGKSSGFMHIKQFFIFPMLFSLGCLFGGLLAYLPVSMKWFILKTAGHWTVWIIALPLGWTYGATSSNILFAIRNDCPQRIKEFALSNVTSANAFGQMIGNIVAIFVAGTVLNRYSDM